jgi:hypothetical protein
MADEENAGIFTFSRLHLLLVPALFSQTNFFKLGDLPGAAEKLMLGVL